MGELFDLSDRVAEAQRKHILSLAEREVGAMSVPQFRLSLLGPMEKVLDPFGFGKATLRAMITPTEIMMRSMGLANDPSPTDFSLFTDEGGIVNSKHVGMPKKAFFEYLLHKGDDASNMIVAGCLDLLMEKDTIPKEDMARWIHTGELSDNALEKLCTDTRVRMAVEAMSSLTTPEQSIPAHWQKQCRSVHLEDTEAFFLMAEASHIKGRPEPEMDEHQKYSVDRMLGIFNTMIGQQLGQFRAQEVGDTVETVAAPEGINDAGTQVGSASIHDPVVNLDAIKRRRG